MTKGGGGLGQSKKSLSENTRTFLTDFDQRGGGGLGKSKKSLSEKTEVVKKGGGGGLNFLTKSKKKSFFFYASPNTQLLFLPVSVSLSDFYVSLTGGAEFDKMRNGAPPSNQPKRDPFG